MNKDLEQVLLHNKQKYDSDSDGPFQFQTDPNRASFATARDRMDSISAKSDQPRPEDWRDFLKEQCLILVWNFVWLGLIFFFCYFKEGALECTGSMQRWLEF